MKRCGNCGIYKDFNCFCKDRQNKDGLRSICKECVKVLYPSDEYMKNYYKENPEKYKNKVSKMNVWRKNNPEKVKSYKKTRKYLERGGTERYSVEDFEMVLKKYNYKCLCCGTKKDITADHVIPLKLGGTNRIENIQPLCRKCNSSKGIKVIDYRIS